MKNASYPYRETFPYMVAGAVGFVAPILATRYIIFGGSGSENISSWLKWVNTAIVNCIPVAGLPLPVASALLSASAVVAYKVTSNIHKREKEEQLREKRQHQSLDSSLL